jgi:DMSO/TMAO reductase YedYZ molybdopterin-dependent catalytic subunit
MIRRLTLLLVVAAIARPTDAPRAATVELRGAAGQHRVITSATIDSLGRQEVTAEAHQVTGSFGGASLYELLRLAGAPGGDSLRGPALASYVLIEAADGYRVTYSLAELSPAFSDRVVLLADKMNGTPLDSHDGPFRVIAVGEKRPARWIRQVTRISIMTPTP